MWRDARSASRLVSTVGAHGSCLLAAEATALLATGQQVDNGEQHRPGQVIQGMCTGRWCAPHQAGAPDWGMSTDMPRSLSSQMLAKLRTQPVWSQRGSQVELGCRSHGQCAGAGLWCGCGSPDGCGHMLVTAVGAYTVTQSASFPNIMHYPGFLSAAHQACSYVSYPLVLLCQSICRAACVATCTFSPWPQGQ